MESFVEFPKDIKKLYFVLVVLEKKSNFARDLKDANRGGEYKALFCKPLTYEMFNCVEVL